MAGGEAREIWEQIGNDNWGRQPFMNRGVGQEVRHSIGALLSRPVAQTKPGWDSDYEALWQFGSFGSTTYPSMDCGIGNRLPVSDPSAEAAIPRQGRHLGRRRIRGRILSARSVFPRSGRLHCEHDGKFRASRVRNGARIRTVHRRRVNGPLGFSYGSDTRRTGHGKIEESYPKIVGRAMPRFRSSSLRLKSRRAIWFAPRIR
jgi:hypothetical protein